MIKKIGLVAVLLAVGVAIALYLRGGSAPSEPEQAFTPRTGASEMDRIADLERALAAQVDRSNLLASRLAELEGRMGQRGNRSNDPNAPGGRNGNDPRSDRFAQMREQLTDANGNIDPAKIQEMRRKQEIDRLVQAGFTQERAEWIMRRTQELQVQAQQAQFDAQRNGQQYRGVNTEEALRKEIGDAEYEQYLAGTGRSTTVQVMEVLASSAAERSGLKAGDQIVSYAGQRVFSSGDLNSLTRQGTPGETVTVEVKRDGQVVQLSVPRGVLGVEAGGGGRGGPGGFGGNRGGGFPGGGGPPGGFGGNRGGG
jgi:membrane-associated protease RseP (regulator of RpoE activity)